MGKGHSHGFCEMIMFVICHIKIMSTYLVDITNVCKYFNSKNILGIIFYLVAYGLSEAVSADINLLKLFLRVVLGDGDHQMQKFYLKNPV